MFKNKKIYNKAKKSLMKSIKNHLLINLVLLLKLIKILEVNTLEKRMKKQVYPDGLMKNGLMLEMVNIQCSDQQKKLQKTRH